MVKNYQNCNQLCRAYWDVGTYYNRICTRIKYYDYKERNSVSEADTPKGDIVW